MNDFNLVSSRRNVHLIAKTVSDKLNRAKEKIENAVVLASRNDDMFFTELEYARDILENSSRILETFEMMCKR